MKFHRGIAGAAAAACALVTWPAQAALWALDPSAELAFGDHGNYGLSTDRSNHVGLLSLNGALAASRQTENASSQLDLHATGLALRGTLHQNELQDDVTFTQKLDTPVDHYAAAVEVARDDTLQTPTSSADVLIGRGLQRTGDVSGSWTRQLTSRLSAITTGDVSRARYSQSLLGAHDYQNTDAATELQYLVDERDSVNARVGHSGYRALDGSVRSLTDNVSGGFSRQLSEVESLSLNLGAYRTRTTSLRAELVCPGNDVSQCASGAISPVVVVARGRTAQWGFQYSAAYSTRFDEVTGLSASASRSQDPSGSGTTVRSDNLKVSLDRALSPTMSASLAWTRSNSAYPGVVDGPRPSLQTLGLLVSKSLEPKLTLRLNADWKRSDEPVSRLGARDASIVFTLRYEWQRIEAH